jgi:hypothetical protein
MSDSIMALNANSAKYSAWEVRVVVPQLIKYDFRKKDGSTANAMKFQCFLVGEDPSEYVMATFPFVFGKERAIQKAVHDFPAGSLWRIESVALDTTANTRFNGCPNKAVPLMREPTRLTRLLAGCQQDKLISKHLDPPLRLVEILQCRDSVMVDASFFITEVEGVRQEDIAGKRTSVRTLQVQDDSGCMARVAVWGQACAQFERADKTACTILGLSVSVKNGSVTLNIRESSVVLQEQNPRTVALVEACSKADSSCLREVTASSTYRPIDVSGNAVLLCSSLLESFSSADVSGEGPLQDNVTFQVMHVSLLAPGPVPPVHSADGKQIWVTATMRDFSGSVKVGLSEPAVLTLFSCASREELEEKEKKLELSPVARYFNVRGVKRGSLLILAQVEPASFVEQRSSSALSKLAEFARASTGRGRQGLVTCGADRIVTSGLINLGVRCDDEVILAPHRVVMLVKGTQKSLLEPNAHVATTRVIKSCRAQCLLSKDKAEIDLKSYCHENDLLEYVLHTDSAVIEVSNVIASKGKTTVYVVESLQKVEPDQLQAVKEALALESGLICSTGFGAADRPLKDAVLENVVKRAKCLQACPSEPM